MSEFKGEMSNFVIEKIFLSEHFFYCLMSSEDKPSPAREYLYKLDDYKMRAYKRKYAYERPAADTGPSSNAFRLAVSRSGATKIGRSLKYAFSD